MSTNAPFPRFPAFLLLAALCLALAEAPSRAATAYIQTNLVSDGEVPAAHTDANLKNPWGLTINPAGGPFWVANQVTGKATLYDGAGVSQGSPVTIPQNATEEAGPTGIVFNADRPFNLSGGGKSGVGNFFFANLDGSISGWNASGDPTQAVEVYRSPTAAVYTGLAIAGEGASSRLYAANNVSGTIDVLDTNFNKLSAPGGFQNSQVPAGLVPHNVKQVGGKVYVTYAVPGEGADEAEVGQGALAVFDTDGNLLKHLASGGRLTSPWGVTIAPANFGDFSNALLVGNFSEDQGEINAFNADTGAFLGTLKDARGNVIENQDLWGITFGTGSNGTRTDALYFAAGIGDEEHGLFGSITMGGTPPPVPLPAAVWTAPFAGVVAAAAIRRFRQQMATL
jgi:uncharacterized protein (TIGR03118 family)